ARPKAARYRQRSGLAPGAFRPGAAAVAQLSAGRPESIPPRPGAEEAGGSRSVWLNTLRMAVIAIVGAGMMGSALSAPFVANGHEVRLVGTPLDHDIIVALKASAPHPKLRAAVPRVKAYFVDELAQALEGSDA